MDLLPYKYDVSFSFVQDDEHIATALNDLIQDRYKTFLYSKKQEELVGTDGMEKFSNVFNEESRVVIVFFRETWGQTPWTKIEETAIKNRAFETGWDFLLIIKMNAADKLPSWIPKVGIWYDFQRFHIDPLPAIIDMKIRETGGVSTIESIEDHAKRFARHQKLINERQEFFNKGEARGEAFKEVAIVFELLKKAKEKICQTLPHLGFSQSELPEEMYEFGILKHHLQFRWNMSLNEFKGSRLFARIYEVKNDWGHDINVDIIKQDYHFDRDINKNNFWSFEKEDLSSSELVDLWVRKFMNKLFELEDFRSKNIYKPRN